MTTLPSMSLVLPTRGTLGTGLWGDALDADLAILDAHSHRPGSGVRIVSDAININADLPFSALWAPTQLHRVQFSPIPASGLTGAMTKSLFVSDGTGGLITNELYYRTNLGASVQITNGGALNVGSFAGTIGGDYAGVGAQLNYTDSAKTYDFKESTADSNGWARLNCGGLRLIEFNTAETFFIAQVAPAALAASYTMTWPTALPGSTVLAQVDNTGQISFSNTVVGLITASAGITAAANQHVTVSGTGEFKHGSRTMVLAPAAGYTQITAATPPIINADLSGWAFGVSVIPVHYPLQVSSGDQITGWKAYFNKASSNLNTVTGQLKKLDPTTGTFSNVGSSASNSANAPGFLSLSVTGLTETVAAGSLYVLDVRGSGGATGDISHGVEVTWGHP